MVYATCLNESCSKDPWWLTKPPEEYASGGPKCPECGTTRVEIDNEQEPAEAAEAVGVEGVHVECHFLRERADHEDRYHSPVGSQAGEQEPVTEEAEIRVD